MLKHEKQFLLSNNHVQKFHHCWVVELFQNSNLPENANLCWLALPYYDVYCEVSPDGCGWHPFTFSFQMDPLQCHVLLGHFVYRLKRVNNYISTTFFTHLVHNAIRSLTKFAQFRVILHAFQGGATRVWNDKLVHIISFCFFHEGTTSSGVMIRLDC